MTHAEFRALGILGATPETEIADADCFDNFFERTLPLARAGVNIAKLDAESARRNAPLVKRYQEIAKAAAEEKPITVRDPAILEKRASMDEKSGYRQWFSDGLAKGKTAAAMIAEWTQEFPHANPDVVRLLREVAGEFA
jgi:hypothetical protein